MNTAIIITIIICFTIICVVNMWTKTAEALFGRCSPHKKIEKEVTKNDDQS